MFLFEGGFADISNKGTTWHYYVNDHLGSRRIVQDENGKVEATYNYYPFGNMFEHWAELYAKSLQQPYKFNGKEYDSMYSLCMYDFGARMYDPLLGRWNAVDPLCEKYYSWSPYVFCLNNPIRNIDTDGKIVETAWDALNVSMDVTSLAFNLKNKQYISALTDGVALLYDATAMAVPGLPAGGGAFLKGVRAGKASHTMQATHAVANIITATSHNYRKALQMATGKIGKGFDAHHTLPQKYRATFEKLGINIDQPGNVVWREASRHRKFSNAMTKEWDKFVKDTKGSFTKKEAYNFRDYLEKKYFGNKYDMPKQ